LWLGGYWWLVLICCEKKYCWLAGVWWLMLIWYEIKVLLTGD
jgi:hypothetical protein